jgi:hypothetical protein
VTSSGARPTIVHKAHQLLHTEEAFGARNLNNQKLEYKMAACTGTNMDKLVSLMSWLCCMKRKNRYAERAEDELDTSVPVGTGQGGYQPTFLTAPYHPEYFESGYFESDCDDDDDEDIEGESGYFESDCDDDDDEDIEGDSIDRDYGDDPNDEKFNFPFHDSIFRFPHKDYYEIWGTRRPTKRKTRDKKKVENNDKIGKVSTWDQVYKCKKKKDDAILEGPIPMEDSVEHTIQMGSIHDEEANIGVGQTTNPEKGVCNEDTHENVGVDSYENHGNVGDGGKKGEVQESQDDTTEVTEDTEESQNQAMEVIEESEKSEDVQVFGDSDDTGGVVQTLQDGTEVFRDKYQYLGDFSPGTPGTESLSAQGWQELAGTQFSVFSGTDQKDVGDKDTGGMVRTPQDGTEIFRGKLYQIDYGDQFSEFSWTNYEAVMERYEAIRHRLEEGKKHFPEDEEELYECYKHIKDKDTVGNHRWEQAKRYLVDNIQETREMLDEAIMLQEVESHYMEEDNHEIIIEDKTVDPPPSETEPVLNNTTGGVRENITFGPIQQECSNQFDPWQYIVTLQLYIDRLRSEADTLMITRKNIYDELMETRKEKEALIKEKETGVWDEPKDEPKNWNRRDFTRMSRVMTPTKDEEESSDEELSAEEYKLEYMRCEQLIERGITDFGKRIKETKGILKKDKPLKGILKKDREQTNLRPEWAEESQEMFPRFCSQSIPRNEYLRNSGGMDYNSAHDGNLRVEGGAAGPPRVEGGAAGPPRHGRGGPTVRWTGTGRRRSSRPRTSGWRTEC